jgi:hypothetical protein
MDLNHERKNKVKIKNLKMAKVLVVIKKRELRIKLRAILELYLVFSC